MKRIYISFNNMDLGYLIEKDNKFVFVADDYGMAQFESLNPICFKMFSLNKNGEKEYNSMPKEYANFLISNERKDLMLKAGIVEQDNHFERLYKLSALEMMAKPFKIHQ